MPKPEFVDDCRGACAALPGMTAEENVMLRGSWLCLQVRWKTAQGTAWANQSSTIRAAKPAHSWKIHSHFLDTGIHAIQDIMLLDLNSICAKWCWPAIWGTVWYGSQKYFLWPGLMLRVNQWKATSPDNIPGSVLRRYTVQPLDVLLDIFNIPLRTTVSFNSLQSHHHISHIPCQRSHQWLLFYHMYTNHHEVVWEAYHESCPHIGSQIIPKVHWMMPSPGPQRNG